MRYHINPNGDVHPCRAAKGRCPYGDAPHFETKDAALDALNRASQKVYGVMPGVEDVSQIDPGKKIIHDDVSNSKLRVIPKDDHEFFPTPNWLGEKMCEHINNSINPMSVLEPQAGSGELVKTILAHGKKNSIELNVDMIEYDENLHDYLNDNSDGTLVGNDFLKFEGDKHYDYIIMNPPYKTAEDHIEKAITHLERNGGGTMITQSSANFLKPWPKCKNAHDLIEKYDHQVIHMGNPYEDSSVERKTNVDVVFIVVNVEV